MTPGRGQVCLGLAVGAAGVIAARDYRNWRNLGPGGAAENPLGWAWVTALRALKREGISTEQYVHLAADMPDGHWLHELPPRAGSRPWIDPPPIPQRQMDQPGEPEALARVRDAFDAQVAARPDALCYRPSQLERHSQAITAIVSSPALEHLHIGGELAHIHPADGSMHMVFSPADAASVIESGWGERHSLAGRGKLPATYLMIYAPRSSAEATVVTQLLAASVGYVLHTPLSGAQLS